MLASSCCAAVSVGSKGGANGVVTTVVMGNGGRGYEREKERLIRGGRKGKQQPDDDGVMEATYSSQLLIDGPELCLVPRVRPAAHEDLVPPVDPPLRRRLPQVDLLSFVPASVRVEVDSGTG